MQNTKTFVNAVTGVLLAACVGLFLFQFKQNIDIRAEFSTKNAEFKEAKAASKRLEMLEKQTTELKYREDVLGRRIPVNEKHPFDLMKMLIKAGGESGLREFVFKIPKAAGEEDYEEETRPGGVAPAQTNQGVPLTEFAPSPMDIFLSFEGTFPQTLAFIKKLTSLERLVTIQSIEIEREENILPYQRVSLSLKVYTFIQQ